MTVLVALKNPESTLVAPATSVAIRRWQMRNLRSSQITNARHPSCAVWSAGRSKKSKKRKKRCKRS